MLEGIQVLLQILLPKIAKFVTIFYIYVSLFTLYCKTYLGFFSLFRSKMDLYSCKSQTKVVFLSLSK